MMNLQDKKQLLQTAVEALNEEFTEEVLFRFIQTSYYVLQPGSGLVWSEVREAIKEGLKDKEC